MGFVDDFVRRVYVEFQESDLDHCFQELFDASRNKIWARDMMETHKGLDTPKLIIEKGQKMLSSRSDTLSVLIDKYEVPENLETLLYQMAYFLKAECLALEVASLKRHLLVLNVVLEKAKEEGNCGNVHFLETEKIPEINCDIENNTRRLKQMKIELTANCSEKEFQIILQEAEREVADHIVDHHTLDDLSYFYGNYWETIDNQMDDDDDE